ncbi:fumarylacetoacetate hydrolase family protein [uncultured Pseudoteredinibacter sp.]|uniref:fumarylacetoacetate hydrolase family protein n=1 Tax=uncultured Pseudoteredinibacter sp. TaxID=1641701 RepID=UPI0026240696|nr:fumarylacetoacetate hydrolase family protein [uncultured Pseudoteredinibacter sp.]
MKLVRFLRNDHESFGVLSGSVVFELSKLYSSFEALLQDCLVRGSAILESKKATCSVDDVVILPSLPGGRGRLFALGWNYVSHAEEVNHPKDEYPYFFMKGEASLVGAEQPIVKPSISDSFDFEGELVAVIGKPGKCIDEGDALSHVAGYTILNDGSIRDWQKRDGVLQGKNFDNSSSVGPYIVTADEVGDPASLHLETRLNGELMQSSSTGSVYFSFPFLISYLSRFTELKPGDAISSGTPGGVGHKRDPQVFMAAGDVVEVSISELGVLRNEVINE